MTQGKLSAEEDLRVPGLRSDPHKHDAGAPLGAVTETETLVQKRQGANRRLSLPQEVKATSHQSLDSMIDCLSPIVPRRKSSGEAIQDEASLDPIHDDYRIGKTLGKGSYARVKLGLHIKTQEKVAIKIIEKAGLSEKDNDVERLMREIVILKGLRHPFICQLYEVINTKDRIYLVLEHLTGGELFDYIVALRRVKEKPAREFFRQIVSAMAFCHSQDIIHRDLKPENLLLDEKGKIKIIDFGFSNTFDRTELLDTFCGSPAYAAPEMIAGRAYSGAASDVWSLGVILFAVVCGYLPFDHENTSRMYQLISKGEYTCPDYLSQGVKDLMGKMLKVNPKERVSMADVRSDPWLNEGYDTEPAIITNAQRAVDEEIVNEMVRLGYDRSLLERSLDVDECNSITAAYNLLYDKKQRNPTQPIGRGTHQSPKPEEKNHARRNTVQGVPVIKLQSADYAPQRVSIAPETEGGNKVAHVRPGHRNHRRQSDVGDVRAPRIQQRVTTAPRPQNTLDVLAEEIESVDIRSAEPRRRHNHAAPPSASRTAQTPDPPRTRTQSCDSPVPLGGKGKKSFRTRLREWIGPAGRKEGIHEADGLKVAKNKTFNAETVTSLPPEDIMEKLIKVLGTRNTTFAIDRSQWRLTCEEHAVFKGKQREVKYEVELCRIKGLNMNGVSFKRTQGHLWVYKQVCDDITAKLFL